MKFSNLKHGDVVTRDGAKSMASFMVYKVDTKSKLETFSELVLVGDAPLGFDAHRDAYTYRESKYIQYEQLNSYHTHRKLTGQQLTLELCYVKSVPVDFAGAAATKDTQHVAMVRMVTGDPDVYKRFIKHMQYYLPCDDARITEADPLKPLDGVAAFNKRQLICGVLAVHGPSTREDILRRVAAMEGKPWVKSSNGDYMRWTEGMYEPLPGKGRHLYALTSVGWSHAATVVSCLKEESIRSLE